MKETLKKPYALVLLATAILSATATAIRAFLFLFRYDAAPGHFEPSALSDLLFPLLLVICAVLYAAFGFLSRAQLEEKERRSTVFVTFASAFAAVATAVWVVTMVPRVFSAASLLDSLFCALATLFGISLVLHFALCALDTGSFTLKALSAIGSVLFSVFYILHSYFDTALVLNSPVKIFDQLTLSVLALFFIAECRFLFGTAKNAVYLPLSMLTFTLSLTNALPELIYALKSGEALSGNIVHGFMLLAVALYAAARLLAMLELGKKSDARGVYADEIKESTENDLHPDVDTHIALYDLDQQSFDFGDEGEEGESEESKAEGENEGGSGEEAEESIDSIDTTLNFKRHE